MSLDKHQFPGGKLILSSIFRCLVIKNVSPQTIDKERYYPFFLNIRVMGYDTSFNGPPSFIGTLSIKEGGVFPRGIP